MMRTLFTLLTIVLLAACQNPRMPEHDSAVALAYSVFAPARAESIGILCAGHVKLQGGGATVKDSCFSGETNIVLCTDVTAPNAVQCAPIGRMLSVKGSGEDVISFARVR